MLDQHFESFNDSEFQERSWDWRNTRDTFDNHIVPLEHNRKGSLFQLRNIHGDNLSNEYSYQGSLKGVKPRLDSNPRENNNGMNHEGSNKSLYSQGNKIHFKSGISGMYLKMNILTIHRSRLDKLLSPFSKRIYR